jgi:rubredoxin
MKKKIISLIVSIVMVISMLPTYAIPAFAEECTHILTQEDVDNLPTEFWDNHSTSDYFDGSKAIIGAKAPATCTAAGWELALNVAEGEETGFCIKCGKTFYKGEAVEDPTTITDEGIVIPATGHDFSDLVTEATCTAAAVYECANVNKIYEAKQNAITHLWSLEFEDVACEETSSIGDALGHAEVVTKENFVNCAEVEGTVVANSCDESLTYSYELVKTCDVNERTDAQHGTGSREISRETVNVDPLAHNFERVVEVPATCTEDGVKEHYVCTVCSGKFVKDGENYVATTDADLKLEKTGHSFDDPENPVILIDHQDATCFNKGYDKYECSYCHLQEVREIDKLVHNVDLSDEATVIIQNMDCEHDFVYKGTCVNCGTEQTIVVPSPGHHFVEMTDEYVAPTCISAGYKVFRCDANYESGRCSGDNRLEYKEPIDPLGHDMQLVETVAPKCEEDGYEIWKCQRDGCDVTEHRNPTPAINHDEADILGNFVNTQLVGGEVVATSCDETLTYSYDKLHVCYNTEYQHGTPFDGEDSVGKYHIMSSETVYVTPLAHTWNVTHAIYPTCTETGEDHWVCEVCGKYNIESVPALGHQWEFVEDADCVHGDIFRCTRHLINTETGEAISTTTSTQGATDPDYEYPVLVGTNWVSTGYWPWQGHNEYTYEYECGEVYELDNINYNLTFKENSGLVGGGSPVDYRDTNTNPYYTTENGNRPENDYDYEIPAEEIPADAAVYVATGDDFSLDAIDYGTDSKELTATINGKTVTYAAEVKRTGHTYDMEYVPARCEFDAYYLVTCNRDETVPYVNEDRACAYPDADTAKNEQFIVVFPNTAFGHNWSLRDDASNVDPHCTTDGTRHWVCLNDRNHIYTEKLPATGHNYVLVDSVPATCGTDGYDLYVCQNKADDNDLDSNHGDICGAEKKVFTEAATGNHTFEVSHVEATCTNDGYDLYTCTVCGYSYQITTSDAKKHQFVVVDHKDATCTTEGYSTYKCLYCDVQYDSDFVSKKDHSFVADVVAPTCSREGFTTFTCEVCGAKRRNADGSVYFTNITRPVDHVLNYVYTVAPTCGEDGKKVSRCVNCMYVQEEVIPATGNHQYDETVTKDPTCAELGEMTYECSVCGYSYTEELPKTDDHLYDERITRNPTCHRVGEMTYTCSICGNSYTEQIPKTDDHVYFEYVIVNPTCSQEGELGYICYICGNIYTEELPKTDDHTYDEVITIEPTCVDKGEMTYTCSACGYSYTEELPTTGDHQYDEEITVEPTCADKGEMTFTCSVCGFSYTEELPTTGDHQYDAVVTVQPTCSVKGEITYTCSVCGFSFTEELPKTDDHTYDEVVTKNPTCTEVGVMTFTCSDCGYAYTEEIAKTDDHKYVATVTVQPTCSVKGEMTYTCSVCGASYTEEIPKTDDHQYSSVVTTPATCSAKGLVTYTCGDCGYIFTEEIPATGAHEYEAVVTKEATCVDAGLATLTCKNCGDVKTEEIPVNGVHHVFTDVYTGATCVDRAFYTRTCVVCGLVVTEQTNDPFIGHQYVKTIVPASINKAGKKVFTCSVCGDTYSEPIAAIKTVKLSQTKFTYTGKEIKPIAQVYDVNGTRITTNYYTVKYKSNKKIGTASVVITFKGNYTGTVTKTFKIIPRNVGTSEVTSPKKGVIKYTWGRVANCDGYQIQYSTSKDFASKKSVTINNKKTCTKELKKLKSGKKYYIRARAFKLVDGKKVYGNWSTTTKKCK